MDVDKFLIADFVIHICVKAIPNIGYKLIKGILGVVLPGKLLMKVHLCQTCLELHEAKVAGVVLVIHFKAQLAVLVVLSQMELEIDILDLLSVENFTEVS